MFTFDISLTSFPSSMYKGVPLKPVFLIKVNFLPVSAFMLIWLTDEYGISPILRGSPSGLLSSTCSVAASCRVNVI